MHFGVTKAVAFFLALAVPGVTRAQMEQPTVARKPAASPPLVPFDGLAWSSGENATPTLEWDKYRSPVAASRLSKWFTLAPLVGGLSMIVLATNSNGSLAPSLAIGGAASMAFGLTFGPSIGYAYSGEHGRAWGIGTLRLVGLGAGTVAGLYAALANLCFSSDSACPQNDTTGAALLAVTLLSATVFSAFYDMFHASEAAQRANEAHGLSDVALVPMVSRSEVATVGGLALAGRF